MRLRGSALRPAAVRLNAVHFTFLVIISHLQKKAELIIFNYIMVLNFSLNNGLQSTLKCSLEIGKQ